MPVRDGLDLAWLDPAKPMDAETCRKVTESLQVKLDTETAKM